MAVSSVVLRGLEVEELTTEELAREALASGQCQETIDGALVLMTGKFTGRSPGDRFIVRDELTESGVDWGPRNQAISPESYRAIAKKLEAHLGQSRVFEVWARTGGELGAPVRVLTTSPAHALFSRHMFQPAPRPANYPDSGTITVLHAPELFATPEVHGTKSGTFIVLSPHDRTILIGGTGYAGEIKKSVFSLMCFLLPEQDILPMHASVSVGKNGDSAVFFGLSGTGKTTLSADPTRLLVGDDEHGWSDEGLFNLEGGCYAKTIGLRKEFEPDIWNAVHRPRVILENVKFDPKTRTVDWNDASITENTRAAYPLSELPRVYPKPIANHPRHVIFLTADAFGILPPIAELTIDQAEYYFLIGYTAKIAGTERGIVKPEPTFSTCFGSPFMPRSPVLYAGLLRERVLSVGARVWLVNTGWIKGPYGVGHRIAIADTRRMVAAILENEIDPTTLRPEPWFNLNVPTAIRGIDPGLLDVRAGYGDTAQYDREAAELARKFHANFAQYRAAASPSVQKAGPRPV